MFWNLKSEPSSGEKLYKHRNKEYPKAEEQAMLPGHKMYNILMY